MWFLGIQLRTFRRVLLTTEPSQVPIPFLYYLYACDEVGGIYVMVYMWRSENNLLKVGSLIASLQFFFFFGRGDIEPGHQDWQ